MDQRVLSSEFTRAQSLSGACCLALLSLLGDKVLFPGSPGYSSSISSYHTQQESHIHPLCVIAPTTSEDVSSAVLSLTSTTALLSKEEQGSCRFAVRSGGHAGTAGAANIAAGVTIDLSSLNTIEVSEDRETAKVGVGATWGDVYSKLDPLGLSVAGSRVAQVGVGGLTLGGGISYFSPRYGWTCDTVSNFEAVLANGSVVNANSRENSDLLIALRGGSNNFGIITRIDFQTFEQGPIWGGSVLYPMSTINEQLKAFVDFNSADSYDEYASLVVNLGYAPKGTTFILNNFEYTKPEKNPPVFKKLMKISSTDTKMRTATMGEMAVEQGSYTANGRRQLSVTTTQKSTLPMLSATYLNWDKSLEAIRGIPRIVWALSLEPLPPAIYARHAASNALGLSNRADPLVMVTLNAFWMNEEDGMKIEKAARELFSKIEGDARKLDSYDPFVYLNYAAPWQDPINSYGKKAVRKLKEVRKNVDSKGTFLYQVPGGFKVPF